MSLGEHDISGEFDTRTFVTKADPSKIDKHPRFYIRRSLGTIKFDIAILELEEPVDFVKYPHIRCTVVCFTKNSSNQ